MIVGPLKSNVQAAIIILLLFCIGAWLGTIMLFNVWVLIWPNQQKILGMVQASDDEKAKARRVAFLASRTNLMLSLPMLFFMANGLSQRALIGL